MIYFKIISGSYHIWIRYLHTWIYDIYIYTKLYIWITSHWIIYFQIWIISYFQIHGFPDIPPPLEENVGRASFTASTTPGPASLFNGKNWEKTGRAYDLIHWDPRDPRKCQGSMIDQWIQGKTAAIVSRFSLHSLIIIDHSTGDENAHPVPNVPRSEAAEKALEAAGIWQYLGPSGGRELELELWLYPYETGCQVRTELLEDFRFDTQFFRNKNLQRVFFLQANPSPGRGWTPGMAFSSQPSWIGASGTTRPAGAAARTSIVNACGCTTSRPRSW